MNPFPFIAYVLEMTRDCFVPRNDAVVLAKRSRHGEARSHLNYFGRQENILIETIQ